MLQGRRRNGEVNRCLRPPARRKRVDESAAEGIAAAHAVDDVQLVLGGEDGLLRLRVVEHAGPEVVERRERRAERDGDLLASEARDELFGDGDVARLVQPAVLDVRTLPDDTEDVRRIRLVRDEDVDVGDELLHADTGLGLRPELAPVVEVAADRDPIRPAPLERVQADRGQIAAQRRGDAREVEPTHALQDLRPVEVAAPREGDGRSRAVVDDLRRTLRRALLDEVDAEARPAPDDVLRLDAEAPHRVPRRLAQRVRWKLRHERGIQPEVRERDGDVGLAARVGRLEAFRLDETGVSLGVEAHHDLAKRHDFHIVTPRCHRAPSSPRS